MTWTHNDATIDDIIAAIETRIPAPEELCAIANPADMGPDATAPAIWLALLFVHIRELRCQLTLIERSKVSGLFPALEPKSDDDRSSFAIALGNHAIEASGGDFEAAATVMFQGALAILIKVLPPEEVISAVRGLPEMFGLHAALGIGEVRQ